MKSAIIKIFSLAALTAAILFTVPAHAGTGVYVNGRQLNYNQWVAASRMVGAPVQPGAYRYNPITGAYGTIGNSRSGGTTLGVRAKRRQLQFGQFGRLR